MDYEDLFTVMYIFYVIKVTEIKLNKTKNKSLISFEIIQAYD